MAKEDLLNASKFLDEPAGGLPPVDSTPTDSGLAPPEDLGVDLSVPVDSAETGVSVSDSLPKYWNFAGVETDIPMDKSTAAALVGFGDGFTDLWRGVEQLMGSEEAKSQLAAEKAAVNSLYNDPRFGTTARVGQVAGLLVDPIGFVVPGAKGKNLFQVATIGAATGTGYGLLGYVDEANGQTRAGNALIAGVTGGVLSPTLFAAGRQIMGFGSKMQKRAASSLLDTYKRQVWKFIENGATPKSARKMAQERMQWTTEDKARLIMASGKPFEMERARVALDDLGNEVRRSTGAPVFSRVQARQNYEALQSRTIKNVDAMMQQFSDTISKWRAGRVLNKIGRDVKDVAKSLGRGINKAVVPTVTRVAKIDPTIGKELISMEARVKMAQNRLHVKASAFLDEYRAMPTRVQREIQQHLQNQQHRKAYELFIKNGGTKGRWGEMQGIIKGLYKETKGVGYDLDKIPDYFPRRVKDVDGLAAHEDKAFNEELQLFRAQRRREPSDRELQAMINRITLKRSTGGFRTGSAFNKRRKDVLDMEEMAYYHELEPTFISYINDAVSDIERAKFLRRLGVKNTKFKTDGTDITDRLNEIIRTRRNEGRFGEEKVTELVDLLRSRFTSGEMAPSDAVQAFKNMTYISTLGNFKSAMTQLGDLAFSAHKNGIINTAIELMNRVPGIKRVVKRSHFRATKEQVGLEDAIQEFAGDRNGKKALDWILGKTGFKAMDRLGKETFLNAHLRKVKNRLNSEKYGVNEAARLRQQWRDIFGNETDKLIQDLKAGEFSDNVAVYLFNQLEEVQPIALSSMPQTYLDLPNGRIFYMLKSFTIKQLDLMRRDIFTKMAQGDIPGAFRGLTSLGTLFILANGTADTLKDFMTGKEVEFEDTLVDNVWKLLGINRYTADKAASKPFTSIVDTLAPPLSVYDRVYRAATDPHRIWEVSPFNGSQVLDKWFNNGEWTRTDNDRARSSVSQFHRTIDE